MLKQTIKYTDFDGNEREETHYFNLTKAELMDMEFSVSGGMKALLDKIVQEQDAPTVYAHFKDIVQKSYGQKSLDGKRFIKDAEQTKEFMETEAYSQFMMDLLSKEGAAAAFINGVIPKLPEDHKKPEDHKQVEGS